MIDAVLSAEQFDLPDTTIHSWHILLCEARAWHNYFWQLLSSDEQNRALRFHSDRHRDRYVMCHGWLRVLLAHYLRTRPRALRFAFGRHGKPQLHDSLTTHQGLVFNLSHSENQLLLGVARGQRLGLDIETWHRLHDPAALVQRCFAIPEQETWQQTPETGRERLFFQTWTRKEAFVKAIGLGLSAGLEQCVTALHPAPHFSHVPKGYGPANLWQLFDLNVGTNISAAVVSDCVESTLIQRTIDCNDVYNKPPDFYSQGNRPF